MLNMIYDKTDKGRQEISTRKHHLDPKLRVLLVMVDGKHSGQALIRDFANYGFNEQRLIELVDGAFISGTQPVASAASPATEGRANATAENQSVSEAVLDPKEKQYNELYHFYTHTIKSTLGLRGFLMQLKVEKCGSIEDFRALRPTYIAAVLKAQGDEMARTLGSRLDQLLTLTNP
jgi:hypothetical protein